jgi:hypothetical protein
MMTRHSRHRRPPPHGFLVRRLYGFISFRTRARRATSAAIGIVHLATVNKSELTPLGITTSLSQCSSTN